MLNDSLRIDAFANQHVLHDEAVRDDAIGQPEREALDVLLHRSAKAVSLAFRGQTAGHSGEIRADHSKDVRVKAVGVNYVDVILFDVSNEPAKLLRKVEIIKTCQRVFVNFSNAKLFRINSQRTSVLQTGEMHATVSTEMQLTQELQRLALAAALLEAVDDEKDVWLHVTTQRVASTGE